MPRDQAGAELSHCHLAAQMRKLAERKYRPPGRRASKQFGASTFEGYYAYRRTATTSSSVGGGKAWTASTPSGARTVVCHRLGVRARGRLPLAA